MASYVLTCCSTADLTEEQLRARDIPYICFHYALNGREYPDDLGKTMSLEEFYSQLAQGAETRTSQINAEEYLAFFTPYLEAGNDILHVCLSSGISGTYTSARLAAEMAAEKYPQRKVRILDSLAASTGLGLFMYELADRRDAGFTLEELEAWGLENRLYLRHWFFSTDLTTFIRGGRVSKTSGFVGTLLGICPLLDVDGLGRLIPREKVRSKKKVIARIVEKMEESARDGFAYSGRCFICHSDCPEDAQAVKEAVQTRFPNIKGEVLVNSIGTTIGSHTGRGTVALFFFSGDQRN